MMIAQRCCTLHRGVKAGRVGREVSGRVDSPRASVDRKSGPSLRESQRGVGYKDGSTRGRDLLGEGRTHVCPDPLFFGPGGDEISPGLFKAEDSIRTSSNDVGILVVLTVILPESHGANLVALSF